MVISSFLNYPLAIAKMYRSFYELSPSFNYSQGIHSDHP